MKHIINYTPRHKEALDYAINMAVAWHYGNIDPVCDLMLMAYKHHHPNVNNTKCIYDLICQNVQALREIDYKAEAFGKYEILRGIDLQDNGEAEITEEEEMQLEYLCEFVMRLLVGQIGNCFYNFNNTYLDQQTEFEMEEISRSLHLLCWDLDHLSNYGIRYSELSDILYDIYHVLRYERYLNFSDERKERVGISNLSDPPLHIAKAPLMRIRTIR